MQSGGPMVGGFTEGEVAVSRDDVIISTPV